MNQKLFANRTSAQDFIDQVSDIMEDFTWERMDVICLHNVKAPPWVNTCKLFMKVLNNDTQIIW